MSSKRGFLVALSCFIVVFLAMGLSSATFSFKGENMQTKYSGGETIKGSINISFTNEPSSSLFTSNVNGSISLLDFLLNNSLSDGNGFNCSIKGCTRGYSTDGVLTSALNIGGGGRKVIGFKIVGKEIAIESVKFSISSSTLESCSRQMEIDVLEKNQTFILNTKYKPEVCGVSYRGCFDTQLDAGDYQNVILSTDEYCEKLTLPTSPAYQLGATVKNSTTGSRNITMRLYDDNWNELGSCILPKHTAATQELGCIVPYAASKKRDYFACISVASGSTNYEIRTEEDGDMCGTSDSGNNNFVGDYEINARTLRFDTINMEVNNTSFDMLNGEDLTNYLDNYISDVYERECSGSGCIIPLNIYADTAQDFTISNVELKYQSSKGLINENKMYLLEKDDPLITSKYLTLNVEKAGFTIPLTSTARTLQLYLDGDELFSRAKGINVTKGFTFDVLPKNALIGIDSILVIITSENITSSKWTFGDGSIESFNGRSAIHKYSTSGEYSVVVEATNSKGNKASRTFSIIVGNANTSASILLNRYDSDIKNITKKVEVYPLWVRNEINTRVNLTNMNDALVSLRSDLGNATSEEEYVQILDSLQTLDVPKDIRASEKGKLPLGIGLDNIDPGYINLADGTGEVEELSSAQRESLKNQIINWMNENYNSDVDFEIISLYKEESEPLMSYFKIVLTPKKENGNVSFYMSYPIDSIVFAQNYGQRETVDGQGTVIPLGTGTEQIEFIITSDIQVGELGSYVSPPISAFTKDVDTIDGTNPRKGKAFWLIIWVVLGFLVVYIIVQEWYKRHYESYLFKNRDDLWNLVNFIYNSRFTGLNDSQIRQKLSEVKWTGEQERYAFRKLDGKRTGMFEIPIFKFFENRKVHKELASRNAGNVDTRFIKQRNY